MDNKQILIIGEKESFLIRVLVKKLIDSGFDAVYAPIDIDAINVYWDAADAVIYYAESGEAPHRDVFQYLVDRLNDDYKQIVIIGEKNDTEHIKSNIPEDLIYKVFYRPVDNDKFVNEIRTMFEMIESGELQKHLLIVDDDPTFLSLMREWLKDKYRVSSASSGMQAIKWLGKNKPDLILLDYEMPVTTGPKVLEMLRSEEETKKIPVIFLTGKSDKESVMSVVSLKPEGYILKNIEKSQLISNLDNFFINRRS